MKIKNLGAADPGGRQHLEGSVVRGAGNPSSEVRGDTTHKELQALAFTGLSSPPKGSREVSHLAVTC